MGFWSLGFGAGARGIAFTCTRSETHPCYRNVTTMFDVHEFAGRGALNRTIEPAVRPPTLRRTNITTMRRSSFLTAVLTIAALAAVHAQDEIAVGEFASLTGGSASFGQSSHKGTQLAIDEINAAGGVLGKKLKLITEDDQSLAGQPATIARKLISQDKIVALLGEVASSQVARSRAHLPAEQDPDDLARPRRIRRSPRSATTFSASASSIRSRAR